MGDAAPRSSSSSADELPAGLRLLSQASTSLLFLSVAIGAACLALAAAQHPGRPPFDRRNPARLAVSGAIVLGVVVAPIVGNLAANAVRATSACSSRIAVHVVIVDLIHTPCSLRRVVLRSPRRSGDGGARRRVDGLV